MALRGLLLLSMAISAPPVYERHDPIVIEDHPTTPDRPLIIEGYEISNPDGPGIQVRDTDYVVIRNNHLHDCGTNISARRQQLVSETGDARKAMLDAPFETGAILVFDAKGSVVISGNQVRNNDYGIMVQGHRFRAHSVTIHANHVRDNHRAAFIWVGQADRVEIHDNVVKDNGLNLFYDLKDNRIANNGGNPIHFNFYDDHDVRNHPDDWRLDGEPVVFKLAADEQMERFEIQDTSRDQRGGQAIGFLLALFVSTGLLLVVLAIPMVLRRVPPNRWYGFRVKATLKNEDVWYSANAYAGKGVFWVGVGHVVVAVALFLFPVGNINVYASAVGGFVTIGLAVTMFMSFRHLRRRSVEG